MLFNQKHNCAVQSYSNLQTPIFRRKQRMRGHGRKSSSTLIQAQEVLSCLLSTRCREVWTTTGTQDNGNQFCSHSDLHAWALAPLRYTTSLEEKNWGEPSFLLYLFQPFSLEATRKSSNGKQTQNCLSAASSAAVQETVAFSYIQRSHCCTLPQPQ